LFIFVITFFYHRHQEFDSLKTKGERSTDIGGTDTNAYSNADAEYANAAYVIKETEG